MLTWSNPRYLDVTWFFWRCCAFQAKYYLFGHQIVGNVRVDIKTQGLFNNKKNLSDLGSLISTLGMRILTTAILTLLAGVWLSVNLSSTHILVQVYLLRLIFSHISCYEVVIFDYSFQVNHQEPVTILGEVLLHFLDYL